MVEDAVNEQNVIVYQNRMNEMVVYDSCYTTEQGNEALMKCLERFGRDCRARIVPAKSISI